MIQKLKMNVGFGLKVKIEKDMDNFIMGKKAHINRIEFPMRYLKVRFRTVFTFAIIATIQHALIQIICGLEQILKT